MTKAPTDTAVAPALDVRNLTVDIKVGRDRITVIDDVSLSVMPGEAVGLVGESGSGKSLLSLAVLGVLPANVEISGGEVFVGGQEMLHLSPKARRRALARSASLVLQDSMSALDPCFTVGNQLAEAFKLQKGLKGDDLETACVTSLERLRIPSPREILGRYPHELSGGMRQRVCSAIALAGSPEVLIADEPTTALDVTTQAQYLALLKSLQLSSGFALVLVTHDLSIVSQMCQRVVVMYAGQIVENGPLTEVLTSPAHPYTRALFEALPQLDTKTLKTIKGQAPDPSSYPRVGCRFAPRCEHARPTCAEQTPQMTQRSEAGMYARCFGTGADGWIERRPMEVDL
jgi:oligopeptide/dipeptide ABC transporter ATP-binding protein